MWYAVRCRTGMEEKIINSCRQNFKLEVLSDAFIFTYEKMKRYGGEWHTETVLWSEPW